MLLTPDSAEHSVPAPAPQWPLKPGVSSPWRTQPGQSSLWLLEKSTSKSQDVLHRGCHNSGFAASSWGQLGLPSRLAFSRHKDGRENNLPSLGPKRRGFQQDTWLQDSAECLFLWHTLST